MLSLVGFLFLLIFCLILLVVGLETVFGGLVNASPPLADDLGELGNFGAGVFCLHIFVHLPSKEEESGEGLLWRSRLHNKIHYLGFTVLFTHII